MAKTNPATKGKVFRLSRANPTPPNDSAIIRKPKRGRPRGDQDIEAERQLTRLVCGNILWKSGRTCPELEWFFSERGIPMGTKGKSGRTFARWCGIASGDEKNRGRTADFQTLQAIAQEAIRQDWLRPDDLTLYQTAALTKVDPAQYFRDRRDEFKQLDETLTRLSAAVDQAAQVLSRLEHFDLVPDDCPYEPTRSDEILESLGEPQNIREILRDPHRHRNTPQLNPAELGVKRCVELLQQCLDTSCVSIREPRPPWLGLQRSAWNRDQPAPRLDQAAVEAFLKSVPAARKTRKKRAPPESVMRERQSIQNLVMSWNGGKR